MDIGGDVIGVDVNGVTLLQGTSAAWTQSPLFPAAACPDFIPAVSVSQTGRLLMFIASLGEIFGYYSDSVPVGSLNLFANDTASIGPISPGFLPHTGVLVPVSQQAIVAERTLIVTRFYHTDAYQVRPNLNATSQIRLSATDLQDNKMPRIARPWTIELSLPAEYASQECQPIPYPNPIYAGQERIVVTGPTAIANGCVVLAFVCPGVSTTLYTMGVQVYPGNNASALPFIQWALDVPLPSQPSPVAQANIVYMAVDASAAPEDSNLVWLSVGESLYLIDGQAGKVVCASNLSALFISALPSGDKAPTVVAVEAPMLAANGSSLGSSSVVLAIAASSSTGTTLHYLAHVELRADSCASSVVWMVPVPGSRPGQYGVQGQVAIVNKDTTTAVQRGQTEGNATGTGRRSGFALHGEEEGKEGRQQVSNINIITFVTAEGIFGIGGA